MTTTRNARKAKDPANLKHVVALIDNEFFLPCLDSLGVTTAQEILNMSPKNIRAATYEDANKVTKVISIGLAINILCFRAYALFRNSSSVITEKVMNDFEKITQEDLDDVCSGVVFRSSSGNFCYDSHSAKMMPVDIDWVKSIRAQDVEEVSVSIFVSSTRPLGTSELGLSELGTSEQRWAQDVEEVADSTHVPSTRSLRTSEQRWRLEVEEVSDPTYVPAWFFGTSENTQDVEEIVYFPYVPKNLIIPERCDKPDTAFTHAADRRDKNSANKEEFAENNSSLNVDEDFAESNSLSQVDVSQRDGKAPSKKETAIIVDGQDVLAPRLNTPEELAPRLNTPGEYVKNDSSPNVGVIRRDGKVPNKKEAATIAPLSSLYAAVKYYATLIHAADRRAENFGIKKESAENNSPILPKNDSSNANTSHRSDKLPTKKAAAIDEIVLDTPITIVNGYHASAISPRDEKFQNKDEFAENDLSQRDGEGSTMEEVTSIVEGYIDGLDGLALHPSTVHANELTTLIDRWDPPPIYHWDTYDDEIVFDSPTFFEKDPLDVKLPSINQVAKETQER
jgi:hypothetical protein